MKGHASSTKFDQATLETQPLAPRARRSRGVDSADLADQLDKSRGLGHAAI